MVVIPAVLPSAFQPRPDDRVAAVKRAYGLPDHYWLYAAHFYAHKNHATLIEAYRRLVTRDRRHDWPLVLRGKGDDGVARARQQIAEAGLNGRVLFLPQLEEQDLSALYTGAGAFVFPSAYQRLGIPVLEVMACGCPVIAGPLAAVTESGRDAICTVAPMAANTLCEAMYALRRDDSRREDMRRRGLERARQFRSDIVIPRLLDAYAQAARGRLANAK
jgi:glycosyltransferase involved in cell wall biosynthesis